MISRRSLLGGAATALLHSASDEITRQDLFVAGQNGYELYRIPGIVATSSRTLLAYCEARKTSKGDWGTIDILLRRSTDRGASWSPPQKVSSLSGLHTKNPVALAQKLADPSDVTFNNPVAIADEKGVVHFLFCLEYMRAFYMRSDDDGVSFSKPVEITSVFEQIRPQYDWKVIATGPGHGIRLRGGRLLVPVWLSLGTGNHAHRPSVVSTIYSDDRGRTWRIGDIAIADKPPVVNPSETVAAQLSDGRVLLNSRSESLEHRRIHTISRDGATSWSAPEFQDQLVEPVCMGSITELGKGRLVFANPDNLERAAGPAKPGQGRDRRNLTIRLSTDDGRTWPARRVIEPGLSGYSDLAFDGSHIYCFYERGGISDNHFRSAYLTLAKFRPAWIA